MTVLVAVLVPVPVAALRVERDAGSAAGVHLDVHTGGVDRGVHLDADVEPVVVGAGAGGGRGLGGAGEHRADHGDACQGRGGAGSGAGAAADPGA
ncbi:hypothetical protein ACFVT9_35080 [Kitasatospora cineracea]|uniref:hypothetical protein n=1 Tax=Kitasatospora cineracea TaxID=88074 RepID=UPI0036DF6AA7